MTVQTNIDKLITVFGGSGFLGRHLVRALAKRHYRIRVAVRRPDLAGHLQPLGRVGQIHAVQANVRYPRSVEAAARDADVVVNLVGILFERGRQRFDTVQSFGAEQVALAAAAHGARMIHVSAIGADEQFAIALRAHQGGGREAVLRRDAGRRRSSGRRSCSDRRTTSSTASPRWRDPAGAAADRRRRRRDSSRCSSATSREAIARAVDGNAKPGTIYELGGPEVTELQAS